MDTLEFICYITFHLVEECDRRASGKWLGIFELMLEKSLLHDAASCVLQKCHFRGGILDEPALCSTHTIQVIKSYPLY
jgi:hypothetical protein